MAADREPFALAANEYPLRQLLVLPDADIIVAHVIERGARRHQL